MQREREKKRKADEKRKRRMERKAGLTQATDQHAISETGESETGESAEDSPDGDV